MGDFGARFRRPGSGIHTVEGNVAGSRAAELTKKREKEQQEFESKKQKISNDASRSSRGMDDKFAKDSNISASEQKFRSSTIGLVTAEEFKRLSRAKEETVESSQEDAKAIAVEQAKKAKAAKKKKKKKMKEKKKMMSMLSFGTENDQDDDEVTAAKSLKDPSIDTSFLPDKLREENFERERNQLEKEWKENQELVKKEGLEIVYSYWDGSGHRRTVKCVKGDTIGDFLELARKDLCKEFRELSAISADALIYVKEDLIIPQDLTFYDLIVTKARGKSGPLFHFDVHEDLRLGAIDSRIEKDESHPGKVIERSWYDRHKHIFPASRWEIFDPQKSYGRYTIHGGEVNKKK